MSKTRRILAMVSAGVFLTGALFMSIPAMGIDLGSILKGGAAVLLTDAFSGQINSFINKVTLNNGIGTKERTKVVPILSVGQGTHAGAAQVSGPGYLVNKVKAVAQLETTFKGIRVRILVPVESKDVIKNIKRISGVGVSAVIDVKL